MKWLFLLLIHGLVLLYRRMKQQGALADLEHLHFGYYENGWDLEAVAFPTERGSWEVWFRHPLPEEIKEKYPTRNETFGVLLFEVHTKEEGQQKFRQWVEKEYLPRMKKTQG